MLKKLVSLFIGVMIIISTINTVQAEDEPSNWAREEIDKARELHLIPEVLDKDYSLNIKRYEYVLIALQLMALNHDDVTIKQHYPFTDIYGHEYEDEIVEAYNAGIIKGDGNGKFRPNDTITRQEIASLVYNLLLYLKNEEGLEAKLVYEYADVSKIGHWALQYIDFCYEKDLMKGIGKDSSGKTIINPLGKATREQAIIMLYRLGYQEGILADYNLPSVDVRNGATYVSSDVINDFARVFSQDLAIKLIELSENDTIEFSFLEENSVSIVIEDGGTISIEKIGGNLSLDVIMEDYGNQSIISMIREIARTLEVSETFYDTLNRALGGFDTDEAYFYQEYISEDEIFGAEVLNNGDGLYYRIRYMR